MTAKIQKTVFEKWMGGKYTDTNGHVNIVGMASPLRGTFGITGNQLARFHELYTSAVWGGEVVGLAEKPQ